MKILVNFSSMTIQFSENEFTTAELLYFLRVAYGNQINGKPFTAATIRNWIRIKHFPECYAGYKIISSKIYKQWGNIRVLTVEGLTREELKGMIGSITDVGQLKMATEQIKPGKQRTKLYYEILDAAGKQSTKKTLQQATLPLYWKAAGIKRNQMVNGSRANTRIS